MLYLLGIRRAGNYPAGRRLGVSETNTVDFRFTSDFNIRGLDLPWTSDLLNVVRTDSRVKCHKFTIQLTSPSRVSPSPYCVSPSPYHVSPSPYRVSPSPYHVSPSPYHVSPSPYCV